MATYAELREQDFKRQIAFNNIKKYHEMGYTGKGIVILNAEGNGAWAVLWRWDDVRTGYC